MPATILPKTARFELGRYSILGEHHGSTYNPYSVALFKDNCLSSIRHFSNRADATFDFECLRRAIVRNHR